MKSPSKRIFPGILVSIVLPFSVQAIPNTFFGNGNFIGPVIPATPVFRQELTRDFFEVENWNKGKFPGPWVDQASLEGQTVRKMTANPTLFGSVPMAVYAYGDESNQTKEMAIHFLDAGLYFGYLAGGEKSRDQRVSGRERRSDFAKYFRQISTDLRKRLDQGCGKGRMGTIGRSDELRTVFTEYGWEDFSIRLVARPDHSVSLYLSRKGDAITRLIDPELGQMSRPDKESFFAAKVKETENGDSLIEGLPMFSQGHTPFCGIHSLAMAGHYLGLRVHPEALAAGADFKNTGSARGSRILDLYKGVGEEIGMRVSTSSKFDFRRARKSIEAGIPLIVWRRISRERELAHNAFQKAFLSNPNLAIAEPSNAVKELYPPKNAKGSPSHASIITGVNAERNEVIFTEPWGEFSRNRRMRIEEMEATAYAVFYFGW